MRERGGCREDLLPTMIPREVDFPEKGVVVVGGWTASSRIWMRSSAGRERRGL